MSDHLRGRVAYVILVGVIVALALGLRLFGHNWDDGFYLHPDERFIAMVLTDRIHFPSLSDLGALFNPSHSPLNARGVDALGEAQSFAYGTLPLYVTDVVAWFGGTVTGQDLQSYARIGSVGRYLTALLDVGTILLAMAYAWRAFGRLAALLTGGLLAIAVLQIQLAHFFTTDTWITFFAMATLLASLKLWHDGRLRWALLAGAMLGAAWATKVSVVTLICPVIVAAIAPASNDRWPRIAGEAAKRLTVAAAGALLVFGIFEPYAIWQPGPFLTDVFTQWGIVTGRFDVPFTRQFVGTVPGLYQIENLVRWGLGPALGIVVLVAFVAALRRTLQRFEAGYLLLLAWIIPYFTVIAMADAKFLRYVAPIVPPLLILTGAWLARLLRRWPLRSLSGAAALALVVFVFVGTSAWTAAFASIYTRPNPRVAASEWIYAHIPQGSTITAEYWDDALPLPLPRAIPSSSYNQLTLDLYADRTPAEQLDYIEQALGQADFIILSSDRLADSIPRLPWRYPVTSQYYALLHAGELGYQLVYESDNVLRLGPLAINNRAADESFTVYDQPRVRIYKKVETLSPQELRSRFAWALAQPWSPTLQPPEPTLMLGMPTEQMSAADDLGWSSSLTHHGVAAAAVWLVALAEMGLLTLPITILLLRGFPDLGWGMARLIGLLGGGFFVWICVSLGFARFELAGILGLLALWGLIVWVASHGSLGGLWAEVSARRRLIVASEIVFLAAFAFFLLLRAINPDLWQTFFGGEKPMDMTYTSAIARSATFPPYDPWFAGGAMNYYYYGFYLVALLWKITGVPPEVGFQLGVATIAGLLASGVFSLVAALTGDLNGVRKPRWLIGGGLAGVLLLMIVGNLDAIGQVFLHRTLAVDFWQSSRLISYGISEFPYFSLIWADLHPHLIALPFLVLLIALAYAWIRRQADVATPAWWPWLWSGAAAIVLGSIVITNSWDAPLALLLVGAALLMRTLATGNRTVRAYLRAALHWALIAGTMRVLFAPFLSNFVAQVSGIEPTRSGTALWEYLAHFGIFIGILLMAGLTLLQRRAPHHSIDPLHAVYGAMASLAGFAGAMIVSSPVHSSVLRFTGHAVFALALGGALALLAPAVIDSKQKPGRIAAGVVAVAVAVGALTYARPTAGVLLVALAVALAATIRGRRSPAFVMLTLCVAAATGVTLGAELIYVVDNLTGSVWERMNTIFKFYYEAWTLFGIAAAVALGYLLREAMREMSSRPIGVIVGARRERERARQRDTTGRMPLATIGAVVSILLIVAGLAYPALATQTRLAQGMPGSPRHLTLDGLAWMRGSWITLPSGQRIDFSGDYAAIVWLREHAEGIPVILEAAIGPYRGNGSRIAAGTGFPVVLGWDSHQVQQRYLDQVQQRLFDVRTIYNTTDIALKRALLRQYDVRYIVVGDVERYSVVPPGFAGAVEEEPYASAAGLAAFDQMVGTDLRVVFQSDGTTLYEVEPFPRLPAAASTRGGP